MIGKIMMGIMKLIISLVSLVLAPIDLLIESALPDLSNALTSIGNFFNLIGQSIGWGISVLGLSSETLSLIVLYFVFKLTAPMGFYMIKLALSWYNRLKP
jgi:hypothetical protein